MCVRIEVALTAQIGIAVTEFPQSPDLFSLWPAAILGSVARDAEFAAATVAPAARLGCLGIQTVACPLRSVRCLVPLRSATRFFWILSM